VQADSLSHRVPCISGGRVISLVSSHILINNSFLSQLDIDGLSITVTSGSATPPVKPKGKARAEGLEILSNATLKLKAGVHYALVGRNGTGKSTIMRAVAEKLIPGIPYATRIAILQQTGTSNSIKTSTGQSVPPEISLSQLSISSQRTVLEEVIERAISRDEIQNEINILAPAVDNTANAYASIRAFRQVQHKRLEKQLFEMDKDARLRSGARGLQARKTLTAFEKKVEESVARLAQKDSEITDSDLKEETEAALTLLTELQGQLEPARMADIDRRARAILTGLGFPAANFDKAVGSLSGGWRMRCSLASALLQDSDILILDEPTNFLDLLGILWLQRHLIDLRTASQTTVVIVSHDRDFVDTTCQEIIILRDQTLTYFRGNLSAYEEDVRSKKLYFGRMQEAQDRQKAHMEKTIRENIKVGKATGDDNKLRQAKSRMKKVEDRMGLQVSARGGRFKLNRDRPGWNATSRAEIEVPEDERAVSISLPMAPDLRFPGPLVSLEGVTFQYPSSKTAVLQDINLVIHSGDRIGILGLNGSGKSTLIKLIVEGIKPSKGTASKHPRLRLGYYSQHAVEELQEKGLTDPSATALSLLTKDVEGELNEGEIRGLLGSLGLPGRTASDVPLCKLSGGQLVRLALAMILWKMPQLLVLDEITTHLDFYTVTALSNALSDWNGAILLVSHDRFMIRRVVEGEKPESSEEEDAGRDEDEEDETRRREVYLLKAGKLTLQAAGVSGFEQSLEKRVQKLLVS
jgi:ATPase subunit of ABC transporter with duplicated ATPase domains